MNSGVAPTLLKARTGLSTPPGRICWARRNHIEERLVVIVGLGCWLLGAQRWLLGAGCWVLGARRWLLVGVCWSRLPALAPAPSRQRPAAKLPDLDRGEITDRDAEELLFVLVVRAAACRVEGARRAVEVALEQEHRGDAERGAVRRRVTL